VAEAASQSLLLLSVMQKAQLKSCSTIHSCIRAIMISDNKDFHHSPMYNLNTIIKRYLSRAPFPSFHSIGNQFCLLIYFILYQLQFQRLPLKSSGQSSWLQIQRFVSWRYQIFRETVGLEWSPLSLVSTLSYLGKKIAAPVKKTDIMAVAISHADHMAPSIHKSWRSPTSGKCSVSMVRSWIQATEFVYLLQFQLFPNVLICYMVYSSMWISSSASGRGTNITERKVVGSIPYKSSNFFYWPKPSSCTVDLELPLTEMSTRNLHVGRVQLVHKADNLSS
jgi:hypothetical protein